MKKIRLMLIRYKLIELSPWIAGAGIAISANWASDALREGIEALMGDADMGFSMVNTIYIVVFFGMVIWFYRVRSIIFRPRTRFLNEVELPEKRENLVLFLSNLDAGREDYNNGVPIWFSCTNDINNDIQTLEQRKPKSMWRWEMPLRSVRYHLGRLKTVTLVCSPESIRQVHLFGNIISSYTQLKGVSINVLIKQGNKPILIPCPSMLVEEGGWEFEQFNDLSRAVLHLIRIFKDQGISENQIMIDFTGGQKVTSVLAASITFNRKIKAQYVQTNSPWKVVGYDILLGSSETGGLGI